MNRKNVKKQSLIWMIVLVLLAVSSILFVLNNYSFYERPIATITDVTSYEEEHVIDQFGNEDTLYSQAITAKIQNGEHQGQAITLANHYSDSGAYDQAFAPGDDVFIWIDSFEEEELSGSITDVKRDHYLVIVAWLFLFVLMAVGKRQGLYSALSLGVNGLILSIALDVYLQASNDWLLVICAVSSILFTVITLLLVNGANEKTYTAILSTLIVTTITMTFAYVVLTLLNNNGLRFEEMQFLTRPYHTVFMAGVLIGILGAVMDVSITMSASIFGMYEENEAIDEATLKASGLEVGRDVMGAMINIMFFAYISGSIPSILLYFKNHSPLEFIVSINLSLELARALVAGIGIVLAIPVGLYLSLYFVRKRRAKH
ncbi:YibE/F family protein [Shouchella hunanensis]|uniref:YibE/F family protein n=1 Tax=Shouchella hunanensis TaxID=766894 RepID=A0ABY7WDP4_9BACI|nr:YibE/F family protein [Shouchella hunanensis]WDF05788.1 YibE/F family protein [Shouchella hunanensis]